MALKRKECDQIWKGLFNFYFITISPGLLYLILVVTSEPVCYSRISQDERNQQIKMVDCDGNYNICWRFASRKDVKLGDLLHLPCAFEEVHLYTHDSNTEVITCSTTNLPTVEDGSFDCIPNTDLSKGETCNLTCNDGFSPVYSNQTVCEAGTTNQEGVWSTGSFECRAITCQKGDLPSVNAGFFNCSDYSVGGKCNLTCDDAHYPFSTKETVCETQGDHKAHWTAGNFHCSAITCFTDDLPTVRNGSFDCAPHSNVTNGNTCNLTCAKKFYPAYADQIVCQTNSTNQEGVWSNNSVACFECSKWNQWNGSEYKFIRKGGTWEKSRQLCESDNSHLVTIENKEEDEFVNKIVWHCISAYGVVWIGINDLDKEGTWEWIDGTVSSYRNWHEGEPDGGEENDCGLIRRVYGAWIDGSCYRNSHGLCKRSNST